MLHHFLRGFLVLAILAVGMSYVESGGLLEQYRMVLLLGGLILALATITIDMVIPRKSLQALAGVFFGLTVGLLVTYALTLVLNLLISAFLPEKQAKVPIYQTTEKTLVNPDGSLKLDDKGLPIIERSRVQVGEKDQPAIAITKVLLGIVCCYLCVSFVMQTKDDVRFVIPYVEFARQVKGQHPIILDTSVIIDGRIADICETGIIDQQIIVPRFVLRELQSIADSNDKLKRARGRRGLDILHKLQSAEDIDIMVMDTRLPKDEAGESVDLKLLALARQLNGFVATNDYNLNKVAKLRGVTIININDLANALKPVVLPGEAMAVKIIKPGEETGQGVGYLDDGTMVVVEQGRGKIGETVDIAVTSVLQTSAGRMIFGRMEGASRQTHRRQSNTRHS
jgi:uncharacterized protein YacL